MIIIIHVFPFFIKSSFKCSLISNQNSLSEPIENLCLSYWHNKQRTLTYDTCHKNLMGTITFSGYDQLDPRNHQSINTAKFLQINSLFENSKIKNSCVFKVILLLSTNAHFHKSIIDTICHYQCDIKTVRQSCVSFLYICVYICIIIVKIVIWSYYELCCK